MSITLVCDYDERWQIGFAHLKRCLEETLAGRHVAIEHVGSTSVPGMTAKPIIDVIVVVEPEQLPEVIARLVDAGWEHRGDQGIPGREALRLIDPQLPASLALADLPPANSAPANLPPANLPPANLPLANLPLATLPAHHLYVCPVGNESLIEQLAFRDYLRRHPDQVKRLSAHKRALCIEHDNVRQAYIDGKSEIVRQITGWALQEARNARTKGKSSIVSESKT